MNTFPTPETYRIAVKSIKTGAVGYKDFDGDNIAELEECVDILTDIADGVIAVSEVNCSKHGWSVCEYGACSTCLDEQEVTDIDAYTEYADVTEHGQSDVIVSFLLAMGGVLRE